MGRAGHMTRWTAVISVIVILCAWCEASQPPTSQPTTKPASQLTSKPASQPASADLATALRNAVGLGPAELATLGVSRSQLRSINAAVLSFVVGHRAAVAARLKDYDAAVLELTSAMSRAPKAFDPAPGTEPPYTDEALRSLKYDACRSKQGAVWNARIAIISGCEPMMIAIGDCLNDAQQRALERGIANCDLDVSIRFLDLTSDQRNEFRVAQHVRDCVHFERASRGNAKRRREASATFTTRVDSILNKKQKRQRDAFIAARAANEAIESAASTAGE